MHNLNIIYDNWIDVVDNVGNNKQISARELILNASDYKVFNMKDRLRYVGVLRVLLAFILDAYEINTIHDIHKFLATGFSPETFDNYVSNCEKKLNGCFSLYSENPFMQGRYNKLIDKALKPISNLETLLESGNNAVIYNNYDRIRTMSLTLAEVAQALCTINQFTTAGTFGPSGVNGAPPYYFVIEGKNLLETLLFNLPLASEYPSRDFVNGVLPSWRIKAEVLNKTYVETSVVSSYTARSRRIVLGLPDSAGLVKTCYMTKGEIFAGHDSWIDPMCFYKRTYNKKDKTYGKHLNLKHSLNKDVWRNLIGVYDITIADGNHDLIILPLTVRQLSNYYLTYCDDKDFVSGVAVGLATTNAKIDGLVVSNLAFPMNILTDREKQLVFVEVQRLMEYVGTLLDSVKDYVDLKSFYNKMNRFLYAENILNIDTDLDGAFEVAKNYVKLEVENLLDMGLLRLGSNTKLISYYIDSTKTILSKINKK